MRERRFNQPLSYIIRRDKSLYWLMWGREIPTDTVFARDEPGFKLGCSLSNAPKGPTSDNGLVMILEMKRKERNKELFNKGRKICSRCSVEKDLGEFLKTKVSRRGKEYKQPHCRLCGKAISKKWIQDNPERMKVLRKIHNKRWKARNPLKENARKRNWERNNRDHVRAYNRKYYRARYDSNPEPYIRKSLKRQNILKTQQTPAYADKEAIAIIYLEMARLNREKGYQAYHVDHIIPLNGELVSGFHVETNLRIIEKEENCAKSNSFTPCSDSEIPPSELEVSSHLFAVK